MAKPCDLGEIRSLLEFCETGSQVQKLETILRHKSIRNAAKALGMNQSVLSRTIQGIRLRAARKGFAPANDMTRIAAPGFSVKGVSTYYPPDDEHYYGQWVKTDREREDIRLAIQTFIKELTEDLPPRKPTKAKSPKKHDPEVMIGYPLGDHHWGMYSHAAETGADYDLKIANRCLEDAFDYLIDNSPESETALFVNLGDALHINDRKNQTPQSGHILDVDSRYQKVIQSAARGFHYVSERLLSKHKKVRIVHLPGNHDPDAALCLQLITDAWFRNEPRVEVVVSPAHFQYHKFGQNMIAMTHGDTIKLPDLPGIMAAQQPEMWGETKYRTAWTGHVHHAQQLATKEYRAAKIESFGVLAPNDAYGASRGFVAQREMSAIAFRKSGGEMSRVTYNVDLA